MREDWSGPAVVCLRRAVVSDVPVRGLVPPTSAPPGAQPGSVNRIGAVSVATPSGLLGCKPDEVAWWSWVGSSVRWVWVQCAWMPEDA